MNNIHITKCEEGWQVKEAKTGRVFSVSSTQQAAIEYGTMVARSSESEILIHGRNGKIRERNTFGNDPFPPKG